MQGLVVIGYAKQTILIYIVIRNTWKIIKILLRVATIPDKHLAYLDSLVTTLRGIFLWYRFI